MIRRTLCIALTTCAVGTLSTSLHAAISAEEAARLDGPELTPIGAEMAGNAEGTIPPWTGGLRELP